MSVADRVRRFRARRRRGAWLVVVEHGCRCLAEGRIPSSDCRTAQLGCLGFRLLSLGYVSEEELVDPEKRAIALGRAFEDALGL